MINKLATIMVLQIWEITFATTFSSICWSGWQSPFHVSTISKNCKKNYGKICIPRLNNFIHVAIYPFPCKRNLWMKKRKIHLKACTHFLSIIFLEKYNFMIHIKYYKLKVYRVSHHLKFDVIWYFIYR